LRPDCDDVIELAELLVCAAVCLSEEDRREVGGGGSLERPIVISVLS
jgi:hypothetical protein